MLAESLYTFHANFFFFFFQRYAQGSLKENDCAFFEQYQAQFRREERAETAFRLLSERVTGRLCWEATEPGNRLF